MSTALIAAGGLGTMVPAAMAYDGTKCQAPGKCWEPKPGYLGTIAGSEYDPKELAKQGESMRFAEARNKTRAENFKKTGMWVYDVSKIR